MFIFKFVKKALNMFDFPVMCNSIKITIELFFPSSWHTNIEQLVLYFWSTKTFRVGKMKTLKIVLPKIHVTPLLPMYDTEECIFTLIRLVLWGKWTEKKNIAQRFISFSKRKTSCWRHLFSYDWFFETILIIKKFISFHKNFMAKCGS